MEIKIEKKADVEARTEKPPSSGGIRITGAANLDADRIVGTVVVELFGVDAVVRMIEVAPEDLERAGVLMSTLRRRFDTRDLCVEHGLFEAKRPYYDCPVCGKNASVVPEQEPIDPMFAPACSAACRGLWERSQPAPIVKRAP